MHHLPRQLFGGKVHLLRVFLQFNRSIFFKRKRRAVSLAVFHKIVREANPTGGYAERDLVCADLDDCVMPAVESVGGCVGAKQGSPGGPEFAVELLFD